MGARVWYLRMGAPSTVQLGQTNTITDVFGAHPGSPTGAVIDLNDGITFSLVEPSGSEGLGGAFDWGKPAPQVYESGNARTIGKAVQRRNYGENRKLLLHIFWGIGSSWATWNTAIHNLVKTLEAIGPST